MSMSLLPIIFIIFFPYHLCSILEINSGLICARQALAHWAITQLCSYFSFGMQYSDKWTGKASGSGIYHCRRGESAGGTADNFRGKTKGRIQINLRGGGTALSVHRLRRAEDKRLQHCSQWTVSFGKCHLFWHQSHRSQQEIGRASCRKSVG